MRLFKYLGKHKGAVALVFVLLVCQAFCDLMLPNYTAQIVDVGIQQAGVDHASTTELSAETYQSIAAQLDGDEGELLAASYELGPSGTYTLNDFGKRNRSALDEALSAPLAAAYLGIDASSLDEEIVGQQAIVAARAEYAALGYDMGAMQVNALLIIALKMMGFVLASMLIAALIGFVASRTGAKIGRELREKLFVKVMSFSDAEVQRFSAASLITRGTNDVQQIQMTSILILRMVLYAPILAIGGIIMISRMDVSIGWVIGVAIMAIVVVVIALMLIALPKFKIMQKLIDRVNLVSREMLTGVQVVRAFGQQEHEQRRFDDASSDLMRTQLFTNRVMIFMMPIMMMIMNLLSVVIVWMGAGQIDAGNLQTGDLIAFITYSMIIVSGFLMLSMLAIILPRADVSAQRIDEVLDATISIADAGDAGESAWEESTDARLDGARISFDHVSFSYEDGTENVLHDVTFEVNPGETLAIVGSTGSGKSTILKLIERFYDATEGSVLIDGVDARNIPLRELRAQLGYVPQKAFLFTGTIESNVGYGQDEPSEAIIREALDIAQASDFVSALDEGLAAEITQGGTNVSGGQRQRLAIARALATDARALLFDDSFSALDYKTDAALRTALAQRLPGKTQVIVAQRIATVMHAHRIVVLDEGCIVGQGTHAQLMRSCPQYREIAYSQLSPEELGDGVASADEGQGGDVR